MKKKMTPETNKDLGVSDTNPIDELVIKLVEEVKGLFAKYAALAEQKLGGKFSAGLYPFLRQVEGGSFRPDARVVILPIKTNATNDDTTGTDTKESGEGEEPAGSKESSEAQTTAG